MRFRLRDILLAVLLATIYLAAFRLVLNSVNENHLGGTDYRWFISRFALLFMCMYVPAVYIIGKIRRNRCQPIICEVPRIVCWPFWFMQALTIIVFALWVGSQHSEGLVIGFTGGYVISVFYFVESLVRSTASISAAGILHGWILTPWSRVRIVETTKSPGAMLRTGSRWFGMTYGIPQEFEDQILGFASCANPTIAFEKRTQTNIP